MDTLLSYDDIVLVPHGHADVDALVSSALLQEILRAYGKETRVLLVDLPDAESLELIEEHELMFPMNTISEDDLTGRENLIVLDWFKYPNGQERTFACFDHHPSEYHPDYPIYVNMDYSCAAKLIYDLFYCGNNTGISYDDRKRIIKNVLYCISIDTNGFRSAKFNKSDIPWIEYACEAIDASYEEIERIGFCLTDMRDGLAAALEHGRKDYLLESGRHAKITYIVVEGWDRADEPLWWEAMVENLASDRMNDDFWFIICDMKDMKTYVLCMNDENMCSSYDIVKTEGDVMEFDGIMSRGKNIFPLLEKMDDERTDSSEK